MTTKCEQQYRERSATTTFCFRFPSNAKKKFNDLGNNCDGHKRPINSTTEGRYFNPIDIRNTAAAEETNNNNQENKQLTRLKWSNKTISNSKTVHNNSNPKDLGRAAVQKETNNNNNNEKAINKKRLKKEPEKGNSDLTIKENNDGTEVLILLPCCHPNKKISHED